MKSTPRNLLFRRAASAWRIPVRRVSDHQPAKHRNPDVAQHVVDGLPESIRARRTRLGVLGRTVVAFAPNDSRRLPQLPGQAELCQHAVQRIDLLAHILGVVAGAVLGLIVSGPRRALSRSRTTGIPNAIDLGAAGQVVSALFAVALVAGAWVAQLGSAPR